MYPSSNHRQTNKTKKRYQRLLTRLASRPSCLGVALSTVHRNVPRLAAPSGNESFQSAPSHLSFQQDSPRYSHLAFLVCCSWCGFIFHFFASYKFALPACPFVCTRTRVTSRAESKMVCPRLATTPQHSGV